VGSGWRERPGSGIGAAAGPEAFYDALALDYHLLFADWWTAAQWHGEVIARVLADRGVRPPARVLDCTCVDGA
jgi:glycine/sarcosine N-methyltransferase